MNKNENKSWQGLASASLGVDGVDFASEGEVEGVGVEEVVEDEVEGLGLELVGHVGDAEGAGGVVLEEALEEGLVVLVLLAHDVVPEGFADHALVGGLEEAEVALLVRGANLDVDADEEACELDALGEGVEGVLGEVEELEEARRGVDLVRLELGQLRRLEAAAVLQTGLEVRLADLLVALLLQQLLAQHLQRVLQGFLARQALRRTQPLEVVSPEELAQHQHALVHRLLARHQRREERPLHRPKQAGG